MCYIFAMCAHGKKINWRVRDRKHTTNYPAHGKEPDSGSAEMSDFWLTLWILLLANALDSAHMLWVHAFLN